MIKVIQEPIRLDHHTILLLHIFTRCDNFADLWLVDSKQYVEEDYNYKEPAKKFFKQFKDVSCIAFLQALRDEINVPIKEWKDRVNDD